MAKRDSAKDINWGGAPKMKHGQQGKGSQTSGGAHSYHRDGNLDVSWGKANKPDSFPGQKCMSTNRVLTKTTGGKMNTAHGVVPHTPMNTSNHNMMKGSHKIGCDVRNFRNILSGQQSGIKGDARHGSQPKGHKSKA